jgi:hypothetical protein
VIYVNVGITKAHIIVQLIYFKMSGFGENWQNVLMVEAKKIDNEIFSVTKFCKSCTLEGLKYT